MQRAKRILNLKRINLIINNQKLQKPLYRISKVQFR